MVPVYYLCNQIGLGLRRNLRQCSGVTVGGLGVGSGFTGKFKFSFTMRFVQLRAKLVQLLACPVTMTTYTGT